VLRVVHDMGKVRSATTSVKHPFALRSCHPDSGIHNTREEGATKVSTTVRMTGPLTKSHRKVSSP
jgi:hypothetical protein